MFGTAYVFEVILKHLLANKAFVRLRVGHIHGCLSLVLRRFTQQSSISSLEGGRLFRGRELIEGMSEAFMRRGLV